MSQADGRAGALDSCVGVQVSWSLGVALVGSGAAAAAAAAAAAVVSTCIVAGGDIGSMPPVRLALSART